jgi:hypothetical protein
MALAHPVPGELIDVLGSGPSVPQRSQTLVRTEHLEIFRYALTAGKVVGTQAAAGLMVVQCLEGSVDFVALGETRRLTAGTMLYLPTRRALCERGRRQDPQARCRELDRERQPVALSQSHRRCLEGLSATHARGRRG